MYRAIIHVIKVEWKTVYGLDRDRNPSIGWVFSCFLPNNGLTIGQRHAMIWYAAGGCRIPPLR